MNDAYEVSITLCRVFECEGVKVVTDALSLEFLTGSTVDYHREMIRSSFVISNNPNADQGCSCIYPEMIFHGSIIIIL